MSADVPGNATLGAHVSDRHRDPFLGSAVAMVYHWLLRALASGCSGFHWPLPRLSRVVAALTAFWPFYSELSAALIVLPGLGALTSAICGPRELSEQ